MWNKRKSNSHCEIKFEKRSDKSRANKKAEKWHNFCLLVVQLRTEWEVRDGWESWIWYEKGGAQWGLNWCHQDAAMWRQHRFSAKTSSRLIWMASHWATCPESCPPARQKSMVDRSLWWNLISLIYLHQVKWCMSIWCDILRRNEQIWQIRLEIRKTAICLWYLLAVSRADEKIKANQN